MSSKNQYTALERCVSVVDVNGHRHEYGCRAQLVIDLSDDPYSRIAT